MKLSSSAFENGQTIPSEYAFGKVDPQQQVALSANRNPPLSWSDLPVGTQSLVLICHDPDVPSRPDDVNQAGRTIPADLPRIDFYHWILVDLPPVPNEIKVGEFADGVIAKGKSGPEGPRGTRQGINNYTDWFDNDPTMGGSYFGYDGPCPPWNDSIVHHYVFTLYALDIPRCPVADAFRGPEVLNAIAGHVLAQTSLTGTYSLNPAISV